MQSRTFGKTRTKVVVAVGFVLPLLVGVALATPGFGILSAPVHARGTLAPTTGENLIVNSKSGVHVKTKGSVDLVTQEIRIAPGGHTGWHSHPGPVLVTVQAGSLQLIYADDSTCQGTVYEAGDSFVDRGDETAHIAGLSLRGDRPLGDVLRARELPARHSGSTSRRLKPGASRKAGLVEYEPAATLGYSQTRCSHSFPPRTIPGPRPARWVVRGLRLTPMPRPGQLIGRGRELDELGHVLDAAARGRGGLLLVGGEAGVGKTALVRTALERSNMHVHHIDAAKETSEPYAPLVSLLRSLLRTGPECFRRLGLRRCPARAPAA